MTLQKRIKDLSEESEQINDELVRLSQEMKDTVKQKNSMYRNDYYDKIERIRYQKNSLISRLEYVDDQLLIFTTLQQIIDNQTTTTKTPKIPKASPKATKTARKTPKATKATRKNKTP